MMFLSTTLGRQFSSPAAYSLLQDLLDALGLHGFAWTYSGADLQKHYTCLIDPKSSLSLAQGLS